MLAVLSLVSPECRGHDGNAARPGWIRCARRAWIVVLACAIAVLGAITPAHAEDSFLAPEQAFRLTASMADPATVVLHFKVAPGYYLYRERMLFAVSSGASSDGANTAPGALGYATRDGSQGGDGGAPTRLALARDTAGQSSPPLLSVPAPVESREGDPGQARQAGFANARQGQPVQDAATQGDRAQGASPGRLSLIGTARFPAGDIKYDPTFDKKMEVYHQDVDVSVPLSPGAGAFILKVTSQGCAEAGICYPPMEQQVSLAPVSGGYRVDGIRAPDEDAPGMAASTPAGTIGSLLAAGDTGLADAIGGLGLLRTAGVFLLLGILLAFTPCVLPMVPILSSIVLGGQATGRRVSRLRGLGLAAAYVLGMSLVYTALGVAAGLSGAGLAAWLQNPWVLGLFAAVLAVLALAMFDVFSLQVPTGLQARLHARSATIPGGRATGALLMGAVSALIVGPCVAAPLAGALLYISQSRDVMLGATALFALAWGMGVPLLLVGGSAGALLPRAGAWMVGVKWGFGVLLLGTAWWMVAPVLPSWIAMVGWAFLLVLAAVLLWTPVQTHGAAAPGHHHAVHTPGIGQGVRRTLGLLSGLAGALVLIGVSSGGRDLFQPLAHLASMQSGIVRNSDGLAAPVFRPVASSAELSAILATADRPVMLDFYADWCVSCHEMERFTFNDPAVAARMKQMLLLRADVTANNAQDRELLKRFRLFGPPGMIFFSAAGEEMKEARVVGFKRAGVFADILDGALTRSR